MFGTTLCKSINHRWRAIGAAVRMPVGLADRWPATAADCRHRDHWLEYCSGDVCAHQMLIDRPVCCGELDAELIDFTAAHFI